MVSELAKDRVAVLKTKLDQLYARIDYRVRTEATNAKVKLTEKMVENTVITDPEYVKLQQELLVARKDNGMLVCGVEALAQRKEMLISLGANARASLTAGPRINEEATKAKAHHIAKQHHHEVAEEEGTDPAVSTPRKRSPLRASE
jgi:ATP-dependent protease HslVU (ClpYQ) peptidase subunit